MPVWHASISVWSAVTERKLDRPAVAERYGVDLLRGVGGDTEWWYWNPAALVGHIRVPVTEREYRYCPRGPVVADAGESGPERPRTRG